MNRSAKGGFGRARTMRAKAFSFTHRTKVIADGTERKNSAVTSGGLTESLGGTRVSGPISTSEGASDALPVDGRLCSTTTPVKAVGPSNRRSEVDRGRQPAKTVGKREEAR